MTRSPEVDSGPARAPYLLPVDAVLATLGSDADEGLSAAEAAARLGRHGPEPHRRREAAVGVARSRWASCAIR